jgi:oxepin-CoA hydrolase/3-oxo-5,6-dehydrosuberyl-CoA semialdehyde dehydrogenase
MRPFFRKLALTTLNHVPETAVEGEQVMATWPVGTTEGQPLYDAVTGETIAAVSTKGLDFGSILQYGREVGNRNLRKLTFHERGRMLKALAMHLMEQKEKFYQISYRTGATRADSWIDIEGGIGNLFANASLRRKFPDLPYCTDGDPVGLSKGGSFMGHHLCWCPKKAWRCTSMPTIFLSGVCWKNVR